MKKLTKIEEEMFKDLIKSFEKDSIFFLGDDSVLIMCLGDGFKFLQGIEKGKKKDYSELLRRAKHHHLGLEIWEYELLGKKECIADKKTAFFGG